MRGATLRIADLWRETTWEEAIQRVATEFKRIQHQYGRNAVGGITSSRCTNEETFLVQKLIRAGFGVNNVDTCSRVCHSPTGYGLKTAFGTLAGTQDFDSVEHADVVMVIGANPTDGHPVFASRMKKRLRQGARLIVIDPRRIDLVRSPHVEPPQKSQTAAATTPPRRVTRAICATTLLGLGTNVSTSWAREAPNFPLAKGSSAASQCWKCALSVPWRARAKAR